MHLLDNVDTTRLNQVYLHLTTITNYSRIRGSSMQCCVSLRAQRKCNLANVLLVNWNWIWPVSCRTRSRHTGVPVSHVTVICLLSLKLKSKRPRGNFIFFPPKHTFVYHTIKSVCAVSLNMHYVCNHFTKPCTCSKHTFSLDPENKGKPS